MTLLEQLHRLAPFDCLPAGALQTIKSAVRSRAPVVGERLIGEQADPLDASLFVVLSGRVQLVDPSREAVVRQLRAGQIFGHFALLRRLPAPYRAECAESGELIEIERRAILSLCEDHRFFANWFEADLRRFERELGAFDDIVGSRFLFGQRLGELANLDTPECDHRCSIEAAARIMSVHDSDCVVVTVEGRAIGLLSDRDLRVRVLAAGVEPSQPVSEVLNPDLPAISAFAPVFDGLMAMERHGRRHLVLTNDRGEIHGALSDSDLARMLLTSPAALHRRLQQASTGNALRDLRRSADRMIVTLYRRGVRAEDLLQINTRFNDALTIRCLELVSADLPPAPSDLRWCWLSLGSEGRGEMGLRTDQDNAIVFDAGDRGAADGWLARLAGGVNTMLDTAGIALCDGGIMAREAPMRQTLDAWRASLVEWMDDSDDVRLLWLGAVSDARVVHGDPTLGDTLRRTLADLVHDRRRVVRTLTREALVPSLPVRRFPTYALSVRRGTDGERTLNLKRQGTHLIVNAARVLCLEQGLDAPSGTLARLDAVAANDSTLRRTVEEAKVAYEVFADLRLSRAVEQVDRGERPDDRMPQQAIGETRKQILLAAYRTVEDVRFRLRSRFSMPG